MSIEEAIEFLEKSIREGHRIIDEHSLLTDEHGYKEFEDGIKAREAILALLKTHPDNQPNEPLTLEELLEMDGKPVYVQFGDGVEGWVLVGLEEYPDDTPPTVFLYSFDMENEGHCEPDTDFLNLEYSGEFYSNSHFGLHSLGWRAYRRPPKEETA